MQILKNRKLIIVLLVIIFSAIGLYIFNYNPVHTAVLNTSGGAQKFPNGVQINIPNGSLLTDVTINVNGLTKRQKITIPVQAKIYGSTNIDLEPIASEIETIATEKFIMSVSLPLSKKASPNSDLIVLTQNNSHSNWEEVSTAHVDSSGKIANFTVDFWGPYILSTREDLDKEFELF